MESGASQRRDWVVRGRVQGVGFRWSTCRRAEQLGLTGAVRNLPDGAVQLCAQGSADSLEELLDWLRQGPRGAVVESVEEVPNGLSMPASGFHIVG